MKIAVVRGDFAAPGELPNFEPLAKKNEVALFTGLRPVWDLGNTGNIRIEKLISPVDLNFGKISRWKMAFMNRIFTDAHVLFGLENKLKGFDIAHCAETYYSYTQQCITAKEKGHIKAIVSTVWENISFNNEGIPGRKEFKNRSFKVVDCFLAVTSKARKVLIEEGCAPEKIKILMPGIDLYRFKKQETTTFRNIKKNSNRKLLVSGRLIAEKGIIEILELFETVATHITDIELIFAGDGRLKNELVGTIAKERIPNVTILGRVDYFDMPKLYSLCDLLIHYPVGSKTWKEQYGMALIEAMACGLPVLGLNHGSVAEVVGKGGIVVDGNHFRYELEDVLKDRTSLLKMSRNTEYYARKKYDSKKYAVRLEGIYRDLAGF